MKRNKEIVITKFENDAETGVVRFDNEAERKHKKLKMIEELQCPGCTLGANTLCDSFEEEEGPLNHPYFKCRNHSAGTRLLGVGKILLGFPRGFNRIGESTAAEVVRFFEKVEDSWGTDVNNPFDFPVWKAKHDGRVFLRVVSPRVGRVQIHAIDSEDGFKDIDCRDVTDLKMD